jgi:opacity protein-like surface antigen
MTRIKKEVVAGGLTAAVAVVAGAQAATAADMGPPAEQAFDWGGVYIGVAAGAILGGDFPVNLSSDYDAKQEFIFGGFVGVNHQMDGGIVVGGELALQSGFDSDGGDPTDDYEINYIADGKLKLGVGFDNLLVYVFGGPSAGEMQTGSESHNYGFGGFNYGVGVDWMVWDRVSLGAEVLGRSIIDPYNDDGSNHGDVDHWQAMVRASFHFD